MRAALVLTLTLMLPACSGSYGEVLTSEPAPPPAPNAPTDKDPGKRTEPAPAPTPTPTTTPTTFATCTAAFATIETCARTADVMPLGQFGFLKTTPRPTEQVNQCVGCDLKPCQMCHHGNTQRIFEYEGVWVPIEWILACDVKPNGTVELRRADVLDNHEKAVATMAPYAHPLYSLNANVRAARDDTAAMLLARLAKGECKP